MTTNQPKGVEELAESVWYTVTAGAEKYRVEDIKHPMTLGIKEALIAFAASEVAPLLEVLENVVKTQNAGFSILKQSQEALTTFKSKYPSEKS